MTLGTAEPGMARQFVASARSNRNPRRLRLVGVSSYKRGKT
jgi:hypothetical protein